MKANIYHRMHIVRSQMDESASGCIRAVVCIELHRWRQVGLAVVIDVKAGITMVLPGLICDQGDVVEALVSE
jgi:hypothetical protein